MSDVELHLNIAMTPRVFGGALFLLFLAALPVELASESVTLNSYYPAPSGLYTQMISTGNTYLARDGGYVGIGVNANVGGVGSIATPGSNSTKLVVMAGYIGIGTPYPRAPLEVLDSRNAPVAVAVNGQIITGDASNLGRVNFNPKTASSAWVGTSGGTTVTLTNGNASVYVTNTGNVGIGVPSPQARLDVAGVVVGRTATMTFPLP